MSQKKVSIVSLLFHYSPKLLVFSVAIGALAGFLYSLIIPFAINGIQVRGVNGVGGSSSASTEFVLTSSIMSGNEGGLFFILVIFILFAKVNVC